MGKVNKAIAPKTVEEGFEKFLEKLLPVKSEHQKSISHKSSVSKCLTNYWARTTLIETGSFGNGTGVRQYSDTDYFASCPEDAFYPDSSVTLRRIKETLQETFTQTLIEVKTPSVRISFGLHASEIIEVTPASYYQMVDTPEGKRRSYYIPDYASGWMVSCPAAHKAYVTKIDKRLNGRLKPLIRFVKAWKFYNNVPITSFYLELRVAKYAESRSAIVYDTDIRNILKGLYDSKLAQLQDPMGISGYIQPCKTTLKKRDALSKLTTAYNRAEKAYANRKTKVNVAFDCLQKLFNGEFPSR